MIEFNPKDQWGWDKKGSLLEKLERFDKLIEQLNK